MEQGDNLKEGIKETDAKVPCIGEKKDFDLAVETASKRKRWIVPLRNI